MLSLVARASRRAQIGQVPGKGAATPPNARGLKVIAQDDEGGGDHS